MFAESTKVLPIGPEWRHEPKYDGMRILSVLSERAVRLLSRDGHDYTRQFPEVVEALAELRAAVGADLVLDGELVACLSDGYAGYHELSHRLGVQDQFRIQKILRKRSPAAVVAFDVLVIGSRPLLNDPLVARRTALEDLLTPRLGPHLRLAEQSEDGETMLARAHAEGWEGVIAKRARSTYIPGKRSSDWLKYKPTLRSRPLLARTDSVDE